jgi:YD repeat-containing protein
MNSRCRCRVTPAPTIAVFVGLWFGAQAACASNPAIQEAAGTHPTRVAAADAGTAVAPGDGDARLAWQDAEFDELRRQIADWPNWNHDRLAREAHRAEALILESDRTPVDVIWRRTRALLDHLRERGDAPDLSREAAALDALRARVDVMRAGSGVDEGSMRSLFRDIASVRRRIAFANPLLSFDEILFVKRHRALFEHMCDQYYGIAARPGGGLYVLENAFGDVPRVRDLLAEPVVERGRLRGERLRGGQATGGWAYDGSGRLREPDDPGGGAFLSPDLSFDGTRVLFSYVECRGDTRHRVHWEPDSRLLVRTLGPGPRLPHLPGQHRWHRPGTTHRRPVERHPPVLAARWRHRLRLGTPRRLPPLRPRLPGLTPSTAWTSTRQYIRPLSYHETHEWLPSVDHNGRIAYTRWDYVDRDSDIAHHLWLKYPDGRDPRAPHGNYPKKPRIPPVDGNVHPRHPRITPLPRRRRTPPRPALRIAGHHRPRSEDDRAMSQLRRVTPEVMLPEAESAPGVPSKSGSAATKAAKSSAHRGRSDEDFYLTVYDPGQPTTASTSSMPSATANSSTTIPEIGCLRSHPAACPRPRRPSSPIKQNTPPPPANNPPPAPSPSPTSTNPCCPGPKERKFKELRLIQLVSPNPPPRPTIPTSAARSARPSAHPRRHRHGAHRGRRQRPLRNARRRPVLHAGAR